MPDFVQDRVYPTGASYFSGADADEAVDRIPRGPFGEPQSLPDAGADIEVVLADVADGQIGAEEVGLAGSEKSTPQYLIRQSKRFCKVRNPKTRPGRWLAWVAIGCWYESKTDVERQRDVIQERRTEDVDCRLLIGEETRISNVDGVIVLVNISEHDLHGILPQERAERQLPEQLKGSASGARRPHWLMQA